MNVNINDSGIVIGGGRTERAIAIDVVREFLDALSRRDLEAARAYLAPSFTMTVSGNHRFRTLAEFAAFSAARNGPVRKYIDGLEACEAPVGLSVYASGTMSGHWLDGSGLPGRAVLRPLRAARRADRRDAGLERHGGFPPALTP